MEPAAAPDVPATAPRRGVVDPATPCRHCGLPVSRFATGDGPWFCCGACASVHAALEAAGLSGKYYRLRDVASSGSTRAARPDETVPDPDSDHFLERHAARGPDGTARVELLLDGVHCAACVWLVERLPVEVPGVVEARLDLARARLTLRWDPGRVTLGRVASWLARFGYAARPVGAGDGRATLEERRLLTRVGVAWALAGNVMLITVAFYLGLSSEPGSGLFGAGRWASLALAAGSVGYAGSGFFRRAGRSVARAVRTRSARHLDMDTPVALGLAVGMADSVRATLTGSGDVWFDSLTVLVAALLSARLLQLRSRRLAGDASDRLLAIVPTMARRLVPGGGVDRVAAESLEPGELVLTGPGDVFPVDGVVEKGETTVDRAIVTGESRPETVGPGDPVLAGTTNLSSELTVRVTASGDATRVGRLLAWVRDTSSRRAPVVLLADRLSGGFVAAVLVVAMGTWLAWQAISPGEATGHVVALLVVTCPCALGMATPLAMAVAAGRAARAGIFVKGESAIEVLSRVDAVVLDKTGTLTEGRPALTGFTGKRSVLPLAAALEAGIPHPVARALGPHLDAEPPEATDVVMEPGHGISGRVLGRRYDVGRPDWVAARTVPPDAPLARAEREAAEAGQTPVTVAEDGSAVAVMAFGDPLRPEAARVVRRLAAAGLVVRISSGDHPDVVRSVAAAAGVPADLAEGAVTPEGKRDLVARLQAEGRRVAMVGDGVNDSAALAQADVGIAVAGGSEASLVAADVFLTRGGLTGVELIFRSSRRVMRVIRRNLGLSLIYNLVIASMAAAGQVDPLVAAVAMPASSLAVVLSSIMQRTFLEA